MPARHTGARAASFGATVTAIAVIFATPTTLRSDSVLLSAHVVIATLRLEEEPLPHF